MVVTEIDQIDHLWDKFTDIYEKNITSFNKAIAAMEVLRDLDAIDATLEVNKTILLWRATMLLYVGTQLSKDNQFSSAIAMFRASLELDADRFETFEAILRCHLKNGDRREAESFLEEVPCNITQRREYEFAKFLASNFVVLPKPLSHDVANALLESPPRLSVKKT